MNNVYIKNNSHFPEQANRFDVGFDLKSTSFEIVGKKYKDYYSTIDYIEYDTQIFIDPLQINSDDQIYTLVYPRSSISKTNLLLCNSVGVIDPNYRDSIKLRFKYICQPQDMVLLEDKIFVKINEEKIYAVGNKIGQLVFSKTIPIYFNYVEDLSSSDRSGGFGSTGK